MYRAASELCAVLGAPFLGIRIKAYSISETLLPNVAANDDGPEAA